MQKITKNIILLVLLFGQFEFQPDLGNKLCLQQIESAKSDFADGDFVLNLEKPIPFSDTQQKVILKEYGLKSEYKYPFVHDCYQYELIAQLNEKYGLDFIAHTLEMAKAIDKSGQGTSAERFSGTELNFQEHIYAALSKKQKRKLRKKYGKENHYLEYQVDIHGRVWYKSLNIINLDVSKTFQENLASEKITEPILYDLINGKKLFEPKTKNGIPISSTSLVKLNF